MFDWLTDALQCIILETESFKVLQIKKIEEMISMILTIGILISTSLVLIGGFMYLLQFGNHDMNTELSQTVSYATNMKFIWQSALSVSPLGLIELGLLALVATQILRVGLLVWFYSAIHDYVFTLISLFILFTLIYSLIWRN